LTVIRTLSRTDSLQELTRLLHAAYADLAEMGLNYTAVDQSVETTRQRVNAGVCFVAVTGAEIVGTIVVEGPSDDPECPYFAQPHVASAHQLGVRPAYQRKGVGSRLLEHAESWARAKGYSELALDTAEPAQHLMTLYERRGYKRVGSSQGAGKRYRSVFLSKKLEHPWTS
jgi:GNAT superfamily N-acetyltransferase